MKCIFFNAKVFQITDTFAYDEHFAVNQNDFPFKIGIIQKIFLMKSKR